jgi:hypothetical protein
MKRIMILGSLFFLLLTGCASLDEELSDPAIETDVELVTGPETDARTNERSGNTCTDPADGSKKCQWSALEQIWKCNGFDAVQCRLVGGKWNSGPLQCNFTSKPAWCT